MSSEPCHLETTILNQQNAINSMKSLCFMENMWYQIISTLISCHLSCKNVQTRLLQPMTWDSYTTSWLLFPFKTRKKLSPIIERAQKCIQIYSLNNFHLLTDGCGMVAVGQPVPGQVITQPSTHGSSSGQQSSALHGFNSGVTRAELAIMAALYQQQQRSWSRQGILN